MAKHAIDDLAKLESEVRRPVSAISDAPLLLTACFTFTKLPLALYQNRIQE
jgi:hypothetical protein